MDWEHEGRPPLIPNAQFEVWTTRGDVRLVHRQNGGFGSMLYDDCTHPAQNAYCGENEVMAWRIVEPNAESSGGAAVRLDDGLERC